MCLDLLGAGADLVCLYVFLFDFQLRIQTIFERSLRCLCGLESGAR